MSLKKLQDYILESWLPTKLSILIAGSSISLAALSIGLPEFLQTIIGHPLQAEKTLLLRIVVPLAILCLGTFIVLLLVVRHCNHLKISQNQQNLLATTQDEKTETEIVVTEMHEKIMELLFQKPSTVENICKTLNLTKEVTNFYLFDLYKHSMVSAPTPYASGPEEWRICQGGREYIMDKRKSA